MRSFTFKITCRFAALVTITTAAVMVAAGYLLNREMNRGLELLHDIEARELTELIGLDGTLTAEEVTYRVEHDADSDATLFSRTACSTLIIMTGSVSAMDSAAAD